MDESIGCQTGQLVAGAALDRLGAPEGADIGEHHGTVGQQMAEQHRDTVQGVVFGSQDIGATTAIPVERSVEQCFGEIAVGHVVGPLALSLETGGDGIVAKRLFAEAEFLQTGVAGHEVTDNKVHLDDELPVGILLFAGVLPQGVVVVSFVLLAVGDSPLVSLLVLFGVKNALIDATADFDHIDIFVSHAEILLEEVRVNN